MKKTLSAVSLAVLAAAAQAAPQEPVAQDDPHLWLEDVGGEKALQWVRSHNEAAEKQLASPQFQAIENDILAVLDSQDKIPHVAKRGNYYYNFWTDQQHQRGVWRRTTLDEYRKPQPKWEVLLDVDELNRQEKENWVWHGANCLKPDYRRCLVSLSRGGSDADVTREFDLDSKEFVENGFYRRPRQRVRFHRFRRRQHDRFGLPARSARVEARHAFGSGGKSVCRRENRYGGWRRAQPHQRL